MVDKIKKTDEEWRKQLTPEQYQVTRRKGTERPFTGKYAKNHDKGMYNCICCGTTLFDSKTKFESGTGWPSFYQPIAKENVRWRATTRLVCSVTRWFAPAAKLTSVTFSTMVQADRSALLHELGVTGFCQAW